MSARASACRWRACARCSNRSARACFAVERFVVTDLAAYLHCPGGLLDSPTALAMLGKAGKGVTTRNWATVLKLALWVG